MLIDLKFLKQKYNISLKNILHVGAHEAEELQVYLECGAEKIHWIEANENLCNNLSLKLDKTFNKITNALVSIRDGEEVVFNISNNGQSSSLLELGEHSNLFPHIEYIDKKIKKTLTLDTILLDTNLPSIDFLNIDIQGAELLALKGCSKNLHNINALYLEANEREVYKGCALISEIDEFLNKYNFKRMETQMWQDHPWGDAFYLKN